MSLDRSELHALLYIKRVAEPPAPAAHDFVATVGVVEVAAAIRAGTAPAAVAAEVNRPDADIGPDLEALDRGQVRLLTPEDAEWPRERLACLEAGGLTPPLALWVRGTASLAELTASSVTVTGSRAATGYGNHVAAEFGFDFAEAGVTVVGGGGYGIEGAAHRGALIAERPTVVVLPCGVDRPYPAGHAVLLDNVAERGGLLVGEYPVGAAPARHRFAARVRLLAALGGATVVVEAGRRSGAAAIARTSASLGRRVYGVPGPITSTLSVGVHELLRDGPARLATAVADVELDGLSVAADGAVP
ncbi:DNA-processing protein DprA [Saccharothrix variisporea]|uniref:DNA processing protein n=1 Tax=Saccharothrix variisporea TaxID=543527 RepID=A0A495X742_9PSEU|nr:DNA-processing protein DprA [Saccharothrix variisporea]RKT69369.1 DNA processing protein [Saccharothrix variisporea]